jgi:anthraniloyl-CoA monooxygenase
MRIAVVGGGPGGMYFAALARQLDELHEVVVFERNAVDDTFGFGVVFSDETLGGIESADPSLFEAVSSHFARWSDIDVVHRGATSTSGGHGFAAINRKVLLQLLATRCREVGVDLHFTTLAQPVDQLMNDYDLVIAADGARSQIRTERREFFGSDLDLRSSRYMWLATDKMFSSFTFAAIDTPQGALVVHAYPYSGERSTFIVEVAESTWRRLGFDASESVELPPGVSDEASISRLGSLLEGVLDGGELIANNSKWLQFCTVRNRTWVDRNLVLLGDAAHTAHFSIGSGTKLAMEDGLSLAACLNEADSVRSALATYERERRPVVESTQRAAQASLEWFEGVDHVLGQAPEQFAFNLLTRSRRVTFDNLAVRDPEYAGNIQSKFGNGEPPLFQPLLMRDLTLRNRVVAAPVTTSSATDGVPDDAEMTWLTSTALGGAGLVLTGSTAVSATGWAEPAGSGLWNEAQESAWRVIVDRIHQLTTSAVGVQLTHAGRRGYGANLVAPSPLPYGPGVQVPSELDEDGMRRICDEFVAAARRTRDAGFDVIELQAGHGHLLSTFLSPLTNRRSDEYGGSLCNRLRFPLQVLDAVRAAWTGPLLVRISASDWAPGGTSVDDAVEFARQFGAHGADAIDVSSGEVVVDQRPQYGRTYQTPLAERIRNDTGLTTIAVGGISSADDAASILLAGRADLVAVGQAMMHDPFWTAHAAAGVGWDGLDWPAHLAAGRRAVPTGGRVPPRSALRSLAARSIHERWQPSQLASTVGGGA